MSHVCELLLLFCDRLEDARETLATGIGLSPDRAESHYFLALTLDKLREDDLAHRSFLRTIELEDEIIEQEIEEYNDSLKELAY